MFSSKTPRDLREQRSLKGLRPANHDPLPFIYRSPSYVARYATNSPGHPYASQSEHEPRPEYDHVQHNEPNTLLVTFRTIWKGHPGTIQGYLAGITGAVAEDDEPQLIARVEHARRVLSRLATLTEGGA